MKSREAGKQFLLNVSQYLPVYSPALRQLFLEYDVYFTKKAVVVLPDPIDYTATFSHVPEPSIRTTGIFLLPNANGLSMSIRLKSGKRVSLTFPQALKLIQNNLRVPFLPVVKRGDLRDFNQRLPCLQLNALVLNKATTMSQFTRNDLTQSIQEGIGELQANAHLITA